MKISNSFNNTFSNSGKISVDTYKNNQNFSYLLNTKLNNLDEQKLYKSCQDLEAVFINKMLESMRTSIPSGGFFPKSFATDIYEGMLYDEYSHQMSKTKTFGIAELMYKQLSQNPK